MKIKRKPDVIIGQPGVPYMLRWFIIPRNKYFNIYLHKFLHDDEDRALHDHPWVSLSIILRGKYIEHMPGGKIKIRRRGHFVLRRATHAHRVELFKDTVIGFSGTQAIEGTDTRAMKIYEKGKMPRRVWTLFITGPKIRDWGFHCPQGWRRWQDFVNPNNHGEIGKGCE